MADQMSLFDEADLAPPPPPPYTLDPVLFGADPTMRVVAAEGGEDRLALWVRRPDDTVVREERPFRPWLLTLAEEPGMGVAPTRLAGTGFVWLYEFDDRRAYQEARFGLRDRHVEHFTYPNPTRLAMLRLGVTLFKGLAMADTHRMQVDIETEGLSPEENRILIIAVGDNRGLLDTLVGEERDILERFAALVRQRDPDIIEGHNIYGFDLPFLTKRAEKVGARLGLGRDGSEPRYGSERNFAIGGITRPFTPVTIYGRHVIDTYLAVQRFDWAKGALSSYGLKEVARAYGLAEEERVLVDRARITEIYRDDPDLVREYATHDILETGRLAELVTATEFYQTQMVPDAYHTVAVSGSGEKINSLLVRAYLARGCAIPRPQPTRSVAGGYTDIRATGVIDRVVKADVESLYPSIMLTHHIKPAHDVLDVFLPALRELTRRRIEAKGKVKSAEGTEKHYWDGLQNSFKVLINSFYGYLGAAGFNFNDPDAAGSVTEHGRAIVQKIADEMEATGSRIIEIDTDGVYFVPDESIAGEEAERAYIERIGSTLPEGIRLAFDGRFQTMVSLKTKNYVLHGYDGKKTFKGASLRSRADEPFGREFIAAAVDLLLERRLDDLADLYARLIEDILNHQVPIEKLARRERVTDKTFQSSAKVRSAAVAANTAVGDYITVYERADGTLAKLEQYAPESENVGYYMDKLYKFACRLREAVGEGFDRLIPRPGPNGLAGTGQLGLFEE